MAICEPAVGTLRYEQEPEWVHTLKADIRLIVKSELSQVLSPSSLSSRSRSQDQLAQKGPSHVQLPCPKVLPESWTPRKTVSLAGSAANNVSATWKNEWRSQQTARMAQKLHKEKHRALPFPAHHALHIWKSWAKFLASRPSPDSTFYHAVKGSPFQSLFLFLIFLNAGWMGYEAHVVMQDTDHRTNTLHMAVRWFFAMAFFLELGMKVVALRWQFIGGDEWRWNVFDSLLVLLSLPSLFDDGMNVTFGRVLKLVRMIRVLRLFRVVQAFLELRHMIVAVRGSLLTLFWCGVLFMFGMFCFAVMIMQTASTYIAGATTPEELQVVVHLQRKYGTIQQAMLTLFHTVSGGDWLDASTPLDKVLEGFNYIFALYVFFMSIGFLNVVIGLFCEKAAGAVESDRDLRILREREAAESFIEEMCDIFAEMDVDNMGAISWPQFEHYITSEGTGHFLRSHGIATHDAWELFVLLDEMDDEPSGSLDVVSFVMGMQRLSGISFGSDIVLSLVENRRRARTTEALLGAIRDELASGFGELRSLYGRTIRISEETASI